MSERDDDTEPTAEEVAQAEALARALEGRGGAAPGEALATAALLRAAAAPALAPERLEAAAAKGRAAVGARRPARRRWLFPVLFAPAAAAAALFFAVTSSRRLAPTAAFPAPPVALLEAQARAARGHADLEALDRQMRDYRAAYLAALARKDEDER